MEIPIVNKAVSESYLAVTSKLKDHFNRIKSHTVDFNIFKVIEKTYTSLVFFEAISTRESVKYVMKWSCDHPLMEIGNEGQLQALVEYQIMNYLSPMYSGVSGCSVPRPILVVPEANSFVMEYVDAPLLSDLLKHARYFSTAKNFQELERFFYFSGQWLSRFQKFTVPEETDYKIFENMIARCDDRLRMIEENQSAFIASNFRSTVMKQITDLINNVKGTKIRISGRHSDFGPWNILAGNDNIYVIDFMGYCKEPLCIDIIKMLACLDEYKYSLFYNSSTVHKLGTGFMNGYGEVISATQSEIALCEIHQRICNLCGRILNSPVGKLKQAERYRCIKANVRWLCDESSRKYLLTSNVKYT